MVRRIGFLTLLGSLVLATAGCTTSQKSLGGAAVGGVGGAVIGDAVAGTGGAIVGGVGGAVAGAAIGRNL